MVSEYAYTPWGGRILLSGVNITDRGYTGHEHLSPFGDDTNGGFCLVNMNGRIYDPVLARFLSPDPYVQAPDFTQSFNRYAYCLNNPFKYTDPSGNSIIAAMLIGGGINLISQIIAGNVSNFGDALMAFGIGAVGGLAGAGVGQAVAGTFSAATTLGSAIGQGALAGAAGGFAGGFIGGAGNAWFNGDSFGAGLKSGLINGGIGALAGGIIGGIAGGVQFQNQEALFRSYEASQGLEPGKPLPANDQFLNDFTDYWFRERNPKLFEKVLDYTYDNKPQQAIEHFVKNPLANAITSPQVVNGKLTGFSNMYFNNNAFSSSRNLFLAIGHELVHVQQYTFLAGSTVAFAESAKAVMEVGAYSWQTNAGDATAAYSVSSWKSANSYANFFTNKNLGIANSLLYNSTVGLPNFVPGFGTISQLLIPLLKIQ